MVMMMTMVVMMMKSVLLLSLLPMVLADLPDDNQLDLDLQLPHLLPRLSAAGELRVVGEVKRALLGIKQLKETLETEQHTHLQLIETLTHSYNKKRGVEQLAQETEQKLQEAELHCHDALRARWAVCRPCVEESCRSFYTSTCRHNNANTFALQVGEFFRRMASHFDTQEQNPQDSTQAPEPQTAEPLSLEPQSPEPQATEPLSLEPQSPEPHTTEPLSLEPQSTEPLSPEAQATEPPSLEPTSLDGARESEPQGLAAPDTSKSLSSPADGHEGGVFLEGEAELQHLSESLNQAQEGAETLYTRCLETVARMHSVLGPEFHAAFSDDLKSKPQPPIELGGVTHTLLELGRSALQEVESVVQEVSSALQEVELAVQEVGSSLTGLIQRLASSKEKNVEDTEESLCRQLRRQPANCWRLQEQCSSCRDTFFTECPAVSQQYSALQEISLLVNASQLQYSEVQQVALRHGEQTVLWANHMAAKHAWVTHITNGTSPRQTFSITKLTPGGSDLLDGSTLGEWQVEACLLDSPPITMSVPMHLEPTDPAFINYVTQEALEVFKLSIPTATSSRSDMG